MARLIKPNGEHCRIMPANGQTFTLEELQEAVGGYIEMITVGEAYFVLNEEGKLNKLPLNNVATAMALAYDAIWEDDFIGGNVLICRKDELD